MPPDNVHDLGKQCTASAAKRLQEKTGCPPLLDDFKRRLAALYCWTSREDWLLPSVRPSSEQSKAKGGRVAGAAAAVYMHAGAGAGVASGLYSDDDVIAKVHAATHQLALVGGLAVVMGDE